MTRAQANAEAWRRMVEAFPPLPKPEVPDAGQDDAPAEVAEMLDRRDDAPPDLVRDTLWVYEHLEHKAVRADSAPSRGARALLRWAREYRSRFFESFLPKAMAAKSKDAVEQKHVEYEGKNIQQIRAVLTKFVAAQPPAEQVIAEWLELYNVKLTRDARGDLEALLDSRR